MSKIDEAMVEAALAAYKGGFVQYADCAPEYSPKGAMREAIAAALKASEPQGEAGALVEKLHALRSQDIHAAPSPQQPFSSLNAVFANLNRKAERQRLMDKNLDLIIAALMAKGGPEKPKWLSPANLGDARFSDESGE